MPVVKMKNNPSTQIISVITDRNAQFELLSSCTQQNFQGVLTARDGNITPFCRDRMQTSYKKQSSLKKGNHDRSSRSAQNHRRAQSISGKNADSCLDTEMRKKQIDYFCIQRIINQIKRYLIQNEEQWNFSNLCYGQFLVLLWICRFVPFSHEWEYIQERDKKDQTELKTIFLLWISMSTKKYVNFYNFLAFVQMIENTNVEEQKIQVLMNTLTSQTRMFNICLSQKYQQQPSFSFFIKKIEFERQIGMICVNQKNRDKITTSFSLFKIGKLQNSGVFQCVKQQEQPILISKKSCELAQQKRKKISDKIRNKKPYIENINLLDLLSYRQRDSNNSSRKNSDVFKKKSVCFKKGELKKEIQILARPKIYFEQRKREQIVYEKQKDELTFHPRINPYKGDQKQKVMKLKNVDKVVIRMKQARQQKQQQKQMIKKGWSNTKPTQSQQIKVKPNKQNVSQLLHSQIIPHHQSLSKEMLQSQPQKVSKYEVSKDYLRIPILYIDVNICEGKKQRIVIYDNDKAHTLAQQFGAKHKLNEETVEKLELLLQQQMDTVLARIEQEEEEDCSLLL